MTNNTPNTKGIIASADAIQEYDELDKGASKYTKTYQNAGINGLFSVGNKSTPTVVNKRGIATIPTSNASVTVFITDHLNTKLSPKDMQFLGYVLSLFTIGANNGEYNEDKIKEQRTLTLNLDDYMAFRGIKDKKEARKNIRDSIDTLFHTSISWEQEIWYTPNGKKRPVKEVVPFSTHILGTKADELVFNKGTALFNLDYDLATALIKYGQIELIHKNIGKIRTHSNPHSLPIYYRLANHYNMNIGKTNEHIISVRTLLKACGDLPKYEDIKDNGRIQQQIINPFDRDLNNLVDLGLLTENLYYCKADNTPLSDAELETFLTDYKLFNSLMVHFELDEDWLLDELKQKKLERKKQAQIGKAKAEKKKKQQ